MRLFVVVQDDEIILTSETGFRAAYCKLLNFPQLKVRRHTDTDDQDCEAGAGLGAGHRRLDVSAGGDTRQSLTRTR